MAFYCHKCIVGAQLKEHFVIIYTQELAIQTNFHKKKQIFCDKEWSGP